GKMRDGKRTTMGDGTAPDAFQYHIDMIFKEKVAPDPAATRALLTAEINDAFSTGKIGMAGVVLHATSTYEQLIKDRFEWAVMPAPKSQFTGRRAYNASGEVLTFAEEAKKRGALETAVAYYTSWLDDDVQTWVAKNRPMIPWKKKFLSSPEFLTGKPLNREQIGKKLLDKDEHQMRRGFFNGFSEWQLAIDREVKKAYTGEVPAKQALADGCKAGDAVLTRLPL